MLLDQFDHTPVAATGEVVLNDVQNDHENYILTTELSGGRVLATWVTQRSQTEGGGVYLNGQIINRDGTPASETVIFNPFAQWRLITDIVTFSEENGGGFALIYHDQEYDRVSDEWDWVIYVERFDDNASPVGDIIEASRSREDVEWFPTGDELAGGNVVVSWDYGHQPDDSIFVDIEGLRTVVVNTETGEVGDILSHPIGINSRPPVAVPEGGFVFAWLDEASDWSLYRFDENGAFDGASAIRGPVIGALNNGNLVIAGGNEGGGFAVIVMSPDGSESISEKHVIPGDYLEADFAQLSDGSFVILVSMWIDDFEAVDLFVQRFSEDGRPIGDLVKVDEENTEDNFNRIDVDALENGGFSVAWDGTGDDGTDAVFLRFYDTPATVQEGTEASEVMRGGEGDDVVDALAGNDTIWAGKGDAGGDIFAGGDGDDIIGGGAGRDFIIGDGDSAAQRGSDTIFGGTGDDKLLGGGWDDKNGNGVYNSGEAITSETASNVIWGGNGHDHIVGANGADTLGGGLHNDRIWGEGGDDIIYAGKSGRDVISGGDGNDLLFGGTEDDVVSGDGGNDTVFGSTGNDTVNGGSGADEIFGGPDDDLISGGAGADVFYFGGNHGVDVVTDFDTGDDTLFLANAVAEFATSDDVRANAEETTIDGTLGLLIDTGDGNSVFLVGIGIIDLSNMTLVL